MASKTGFMLFLSEAPLIGMDPHPAYSPQPEIESFDAAGFFAALGVHEDRAEAEESIKDDLEAAQAAHEDGDLEDYDEDGDICFEVCVHDDGRVEAFHDEPRYVLAEFTVKQVYESFGMTYPGAPKS